jgi:hypothetical protein
MFAPLTCGGQRGREQADPATSSGVPYDRAGPWRDRGDPFLVAVEQVSLLGDDKGGGHALARGARSRRRALP